MPARKPQSLNNPHRTNKENRETRQAAESAMKPKTEFPTDPPKALKGHTYALAEWRRLVDMYNSLQENFITGFDMQPLIVYCKILEEEIDLEKMVDTLAKEQKVMLAKAKKVKPTKDNYKDWVSMWAQVNGLTKNVLGADARLDAKRKHRLALEQSLYLTPRSRAATQPKEKEQEPEVLDPMEQLLRESLTEEL